MKISIITDVYKTSAETRGKLQRVKCYLGWIALNDKVHFWYVEATCSDISGDHHLAFTFAETLSNLKLILADYCLTTKKTV